MDKKQEVLASRRGFICTLSGLLSALLLASPTRLLAQKTQVKHLLGSLEIELLEKSRPSKQPSITWTTYGNRTRLYRVNSEKNSPICTMNQTGKAIWEACNGKNKPKDISKILHKKYLVSFHQAYVDCLAFLARLKRAGAIQL
jgi:hypothetical protein